MAVMSSQSSKQAGLSKPLRRFGHRLKEVFGLSDDDQPSRPATPDRPPTLTVESKPTPSSPRPPSSASTAAQTVKDIGLVAWAGLKAALQILQNSCSAFPPLKTIVDGLLACFDVLEDAAKRRDDYNQLASDLVFTINDLAKYLRESNSDHISSCVANMVNGLGREVRHIQEKQQAWGPRRYAEADQDLDDLIGCYRRIDALFRQMQSNAILSIWSIANEQLANTRLEGMSPAKQARFDSSIATQIRRRQCTPNTRELIRQELRHWANNPDGPKVYWMNGMAGTGKTTIAYSFCAELEGVHQLAASFFCSRSLPDCQEVTRIIPTIAYQIARFSYPFQETLCSILGKDPDISSRGVFTQFQKLISEPLLQIKETIPAGLVAIIDALDECSDRHGAQIVLDLLFHYAADLPIKFFITCRPEPGIIDKMQSQDNRSRTVLHLHDIERSLVQADIETYLNDELESISLPPDQIKRLAELSGSLFIYAATAVRYIHPEGFSVDSEERLETMLEMQPYPHSKKHEEIDSLYTAILSATIENGSLEPREIGNIRLVLHTVVCAREPLTIEALAGLLRLGNQRKVVLALQPLKSVLHVSESNGLVSTLHASFPDYMLDSERSRRFSCDQAKQNQLLSRYCFERMKDSLRFNICDLESSFLLDEDVPDLPSRINTAISSHLLYACRYWGDHLVRSETSHEIISMLDAFLSHKLLFWMEVLNLHRCITTGELVMFKAYNWLKNCNAPTDICALAHSARKFVTAFAVNPISRSTPHIYVSALAFWTRKDPLWSLYGPRTRGLINADGPAMDRRELASLAVWDLGNLVVSVAISRDSTHVVSGDMNCKVCIWDIQSGNMVAGPLEGHNDYLISVAFSPDGKRVVSTSLDHTIRLWDVQRGDAAVWTLEDYVACSADFSSDGAHIVTGANDCNVRIYDAQSGNVVAGPFEGHTNVVSSVAFSTDNKLIASGSYDCTVRVWDAQSGRTVAGPFTEHTMPVNSIAFSPGGFCVASGSDDCSVCIWDIQSGRLIARPPEAHTERVTSVAFSSNGSYVISGSYDQTIGFWDAKNGDAVTKPFVGHTSRINSVAFSTDSTRIVSGSDDHTIRIWDAQNRNVAADSFAGHTHFITGAAFSPDENSIVSSSHDHTIFVWSAKEGHIIAGPIRGHAGIVTSVAFSPDSSRIVSGSTDLTIRIWDAQSGDLVAGPFKGHTETVESVAFSPDGAYVASASDDLTIRIWDANSSRDAIGEPFKGHTDGIKSIALSPNSALLASGSDDSTVRIWDVRTGNVVAGPLERHTTWVRSVAFSPNNIHVVSGSWDGTICVWDAHAGTLVAGPLQNDSGWIHSVAFSPDGARVVFGSADGKVYIWEILSGNVVAETFVGHTNWASSVSFSSDGARIVSGSHDRAIRVWNVQSESLTSTSTLSDWKMDDDGWVVGQDSQLLLWVPLDLYPGLYRPRNTLVIYNRGSLALRFNDVLLGPQWRECYSE